MNKFVCNVLILSAFIFVSCENKVYEKEFFEPDEDAVSDTEQIDDSDETDDSGKEKEPVFNLKVEVNEKNILSCRLTFSTADDRKTFVKYYSATHSGYKINEDSAKTEHYFFLWGMRENLDYKIEVYSDEETPELLATTEFQSGILPLSIFKPSLVLNNKEYVEQGFVLFSQVTDSDFNEPLLVMVDNDGFVVWYFSYDVPGTAYLEDPKFIKRSNTVFMGVHKYPVLKELPFHEGMEIDLEGNVVWKSPDTTNYYYLDGSWHHDYKLLDDDTIIWLKAQHVDNLLSNKIVVTDRIMNVDRDYNELWSWGYLDSFDYFNDITCAEPDQEYCDWTHTNAVSTDSEKRFVYFNSRRIGFYKMDMYTREILWKFDKDDFTMLSQHEFPWPDYPHDPKVKEDGKTILFYDNSWNDRSYSRVIEYVIDEENMTAVISFEYDGFSDGRAWLAPAWGDVDYLENGNFFVTKGLVLRPENSSLFELTRDGRVVWELYTEQNDDFMVLLYNSDKFVPPLEFLSK